MHLPEPAITTALVIDEVGREIPMKLVGSYYTKTQMIEYAMNVAAQRQIVAWRYKRAGWTKWMYSDEQPTGEWTVLEPLYNK